MLFRGSEIDKRPWAGIAERSDKERSSKRGLNGLGKTGSENRSFG
jgi:hypothetical protein